MKITNNILLILAVLAATNIYGKVEPFVTTGSLTGDNIRNSSLVVTAKDQQFDYMAANSDWGNRFSNYKVYGTVFAQIDHDFSIHSAAYEYTVYLSVKYKTWNGSAFDSTTITPNLKISYDPDADSLYVDYALLKIKDAHWVEVTVSKIDSQGINVTTTVAKHILVGAGGSVERYYTPDPDYYFPSAAISHTFYPDSCELGITWPLADSIEAYDLEWTWVDDSDTAGADISATALNTDFANNSTRVQLSSNVYYIPQVYEKGYVCYRVRPLWRDGTLYEQWVAGKWTTDNYATNKVSDHTDKYKITASNAHEKALNWQYTASYAEEGKRKEVISYFDGSLHNRQSVTKLNTEGEALVAETIYDHQGRPAINILPAPTDTAKIKYYRNFNESDTTDKYYDKDDFDLDTGSCVNPIQPLEDSSGAGKYYSPIATDTQGAQGYVADAGGYPFTVTQYMPDNTGRIMLQSGVGTDHKIGSGKETKYYYDMPSQEELDRLFGTEIGYEEHYKKMMVQDPNGQISVTYTDLSGKTIATALAGDGASNLNTLPSNTGAVETTIKLHKRNRSKIESLEIRYTFAVSKQSDFDIYYHLIPEAYTEMCLDGAYCMECVYKITISVLDICGTEMITGGALVDTINKVDGICTSPTDTFFLPSDTITLLNVPIGQYTVIKRLELDMDSADAYFDDYIYYNLCEKTLEEFYAEEIDSIDFSYCNTDWCTQNCEDILGPRPTDSLELVNYLVSMDSCKLDCRRSDPCRNAYQGMLGDFSPGGQYSLFDYNAENKEYTSNYNLSVLNTSNNLLASNAHWRNPFTPYLDESGDPDTIYTALGNPLLPGELFSLTEFIENWKTSWAASLVNYHPEYCYYEWCSQNDSSNAFDDLMMSTQTYLEAYELGLLNPLGMDSLEGAPIVTREPGYTNQLDPYFQSGNNGSGQKSKMIDSLKDVMGIGYSIWETAIYINYCPTSSGMDIQTCLTSNPFGQDSCKDDAVWLTFRSMYLSEKLWYQEITRTKYAIDNSCYNGCIGAVDFDSTANNFRCFNKNIPPDCSTDASRNDAFLDDGQPCSQNNKVDYANKQARFALMSDMLGLDVWERNGPIITSSSTGSAVDSANNWLGDHCDSLCEGYADHWMAKLADCESELGSGSWAPGDTIYDSIRAELIAICIMGCDYNNPMGASSTPSANDTTPSGFTSFDEVIKSVLVIGDLPHCTADLITQPMPYGHSLAASDTSYNTLDTCGCNLIKDTYNEMLDLGGNLPEGVENFGDYFEYSTGIYVPLLDEKVCLCDEVKALNQANVWDSGDIDYLDSIGIWVPFSITCGECITCTVFDDLVDSFYAKYGNEINLDTLPILFANYSNKNLGFNLTGTDYFEFKEFCDSIASVGVYYTEFLTEEATHLHDLIRTLILDRRFGRPDLSLEHLHEFTTTTLKWNQSSSNSCWMLYQDTSNFIIDPDTIVIPTVVLGVPDSMYFVKYQSVDIDWLIVDTCNNDTCFVSFDTVPFGAFSDTIGLRTGLLDTFDLDLDDWFPVVIQFPNVYTEIAGSNPDPENLDCPNYKFEFSFSDYAVFTGSSTCYEIQRCDTLSGTLCNEPVIIEVALDTNECRDYLLNIALKNAETRYRQYLDSNKAAFLENYSSFCLGNESEKMTMTYSENEYHYTLYYYDRAGNLTKTVPPAGVNPLDDNQLDDVEAYRDSITARSSSPGSPVVPSHTLATTYKYTSFNQVRTQNTPDGGASAFWYDNKGRLLVSQNAKQAVLQDISQQLQYQRMRYSFTNYDELGRIIKVGEIHAVDYPTDAELNSSAYPDNFGDYPHQLTETVYDTAYISGSNSKNLRGRVSAINYTQKVQDPNYDYATHYSYDIHGNVDKLIQDNNSSGGLGRVLKTMEYEYDLVSGNVNEVKYQEGNNDQFFHQYEYDADNRLTEVYTSIDGIIWDQDANYQYYKHGPLARTELGEHQVQGMDYAYTIHGWLKGVNSNVLGAVTDIGHDGSAGDEYITGQDGRHQMVARDAMGYSLSYYHGDYSPVNQQDDNGPGSYFLADMQNKAFGDAVPDLFNGNIARMITSLKDTNNAAMNIHGTAYRYDQLNRLNSMKVHKGITNNAWDNTGTELTEFGVDSIGYDANGNILNLYRRGDQASKSMMDYMTYNYNSGTNQLNYVDDTVDRLSYVDIDIDDQTVNNYTYDEIGNLIADDSAKIKTIVWNPYGKIESITRTNGSGLPKIKFFYGPDGNRRMKEIIQGADREYVIYVRDAQGNVMATYNKIEGGQNDTQRLNELYIYGSSRLGTMRRDLDVDTLVVDDTLRYQRDLGRKQYELSNHLGNVLVTVTDQKIPVDTNSDDTINYFNPRILTVQDYYPFGMLIPDRHQASVSGDYRYGFQGQEQDNEIKGKGNSINYKFRVHDPRLGRFFSIDPLSTKYPHYTPYSFSGNRVIDAVELEGLEPIPIALPRILPRVIIPRPTLALPRMPVPPTHPIPPVLPIPPEAIPQTPTIPQVPELPRTWNAEGINLDDLDMTDTETWPRPPAKGELTPGEPSRKKPRERGEKSLYDKKGGEWRPQKSDKYHDEAHWNYKPNGKNTPWEDVYIKNLPPVIVYPVPPAENTEEYNQQMKEYKKDMKRHKRKMKKYNKEMKKFMEECEFCA